MRWRQENLKLKASLGYLSERGVCGDTVPETNQTTQRVLLKSLALWMDFRWSYTQSPQIQAEVGKKLCFMACYNLKLRVSGKEKQNGQCVCFSVGFKNPV